MHTERNMGNSQKKSVNLQVLPDLTLCFCWYKVKYILNSLLLYFPQTVLTMYDYYYYYYKKKKS